ncbi:hypothetical protein [Vibrio mexicanus]|uniref:hypothetical protein n=1 Tax=Vibrio mexicanus TaxID=1004326 RepID=UPI000A94D8D8|nr:hypothetical protein [Vibrio mexicanus]
MKHFLPSSVMLTPFVVRHYDDPEVLENETMDMILDECDGASENDTNDEQEPTEI